MAHVSGAGQGLLGPGFRDSWPIHSLSVLWKFKTGGRSQSPPPPSIPRSCLHRLLRCEHVYALDLRTGVKLLVVYDGRDMPLKSSPCVLDDVSYLSVLPMASFMPWMPRQAQLKWKYETDGEILGATNWTRSPDGQQNARSLVGSYDNLCPLCRCRERRGDLDLRDRQLRQRLARRGSGQMCLWRLRCPDPCCVAGGGYSGRRDGQRILHRRLGPRFSTARSTSATTRVSSFEPI